MIKYTVEVLVADPSQTWYLIEQEFTSPDIGDAAAGWKAQDITERELRERNITYVLTAIYSIQGEEVDD